MNAGELRKLLEGVPDDMPVVISASETEDVCEASISLVWLSTSVLGGHTPYWAMIDTQGKSAPEEVFLISSSPVGSIEEMQADRRSRPGPLTDREFEHLRLEFKEAGEWMMDQLKSRKTGREEPDPEQGQ